MDLWYHRGRLLQNHLSLLWDYFMITLCDRSAIERRKSDKMHIWIAHYDQQDDDCRGHLFDYQFRGLISVNNETKWLISNQRFIMASLTFRWPWHQCSLCIRIWNRWKKSFEVLRIDASSQLRANALEDLSIRCIDVSYLLQKNLWKIIKRKLFRKIWNTSNYLNYLSLDKKESLLYYSILIQRIYVFYNSEFRSKWSIF